MVHNKVVVLVTLLLSWPILACSMMTVRLMSPGEGESTTILSAGDNTCHCLVNQRKSGAVFLTVSCVYPLPGESNLAVNLTAVRAEDNGSVVVDSCGNLATNVTLVVYYIDLEAGESLTISVNELKGSPTPTITWTQDGVDITSMTTEGGLILSVGSVGVIDNGTITVIVTSAPYVASVVEKGRVTPKPAEVEVECDAAEDCGSDLLIHAVVLLIFIFLRLYDE